MNHSYKNTKRHIELATINALADAAKEPDKCQALLDAHKALRFYVSFLKANQRQLHGPKNLSRD